MKTILIQDLEKKLKNKEKDELFIDVRSEEEFEKEHIEGFENHSLETFDKWSSLCKDKVIYLSCFTENRARAVQKKIEAKIPNIIVFICEGGLLKWKESGKTTIKKENTLQKDSQKENNLKNKKFLQKIWDVIKKEIIREKNSFISFSPKRQELILIGSFLLFSLIASSFGRIFILIIGILYLFSGISGKIIFQELLKKMPWNKK